MSHFVFSTEKFQDACKLHGHRLDERLRESIQTNDSLGAFQPVAGSGFWKLRSGIFRAIAWVEEHDEDTLVVLCHLLMRKNNAEYNEFLQSAVRARDTYLQRFGVNLPYFRQQFATASAEAVKKPETAPPSEAEQSWLYAGAHSGDSQEDWLVLETRDWIAAMDAATDSSELIRRELDEVSTRVHLLAEGEHVLGLRDKIRAVCLPEKRHLILIEPLPDGATADAKLDARVRDALSLAQAVKGTSIAMRCYPLLLAADKGEWSKIRKYGEANLALSPEEQRLLDGARMRGAPGSGRFPLFINGRAGSGKSTMLQYLAADYLQLADKNGGEIVPLYLTCSRTLLDGAKKTVRALLTSNAQRILNDGALTLDRIDPLLDRSFFVFSDLLKSLLPAEQKARFVGTQAEELRITFARFRDRWNATARRNPTLEKVDAEQAWHVIRSYIKGRAVDGGDWFDPEAYEELGRKQRSVSTATFKLIYEQGWKSWYQPYCAETGAWDDQDLALAAAAHVRPEYGAVFCDEAQDFTLLELQLLFKLSLFSARQLAPTDVRDVPYVFAGDPLQTLNPTGFRWEAVKADFHDQMQAQLTSFRRAKLELTANELNANYRSDQEIVKFSNLIQLLRVTILDVRGVGPQLPYWLDSERPPELYSADDASARDGLARAGSVILLDCSEGEESSAVDGDRVLKLLLESRKADGVYGDVFSPIRAKGHEFREVALYGFGAAGARLMAQARAVANDDPEREEKLLPFAYFMNRLYVAASRAQRRLRIVDTPDALEQFWRMLRDLNFLDGLAAERKVKEAAQFRDFVAFPVDGRQWDAEVEPHEDRAKRYEDTGMSEESSYFMQQAEQAWRAAGQFHRAERARAWVLVYDNKWADGARQFLQAGEFSWALHYAFKVGQWQLVLDATNGTDELRRRHERKAAEMMVNRKDDGIAVFSAVRHVEVHSFDSKTWHGVLQELVERLEKHQPQKGAPSPWQGIAGFLVRLIDAKVPVDAKAGTIARLLFRGREFRRAREFFERAGLVAEQDYFVCCAETEAYPANLPWMVKAGHHSQVLKSWRSSGAAWGLGADAEVALVDAALADGELEVAHAGVQRQPDDNRRRRLLAAALQACKIDIARPLLLEEIQVLCSQLDTESTAIWLVDAFEFRFGRRYVPIPVEWRTELGPTLANHSLAGLATGGRVKDDLARNVREFMNKTFLRGPGLRGLRQVTWAPVPVVGAVIERYDTEAAVQFYIAMLADELLQGEEQTATAHRLAHIYARKAQDSDVKAASEKQRLEAVYFVQADKEPPKPDSSWLARPPQLTAVEVVVSEDPKRFALAATKNRNVFRFTDDDADRTLTLDAHKPDLAAELEKCARVAKKDLRTNEWAAWTVKAWSVRVGIRRVADRLAVDIEGADWGQTDLLPRADDKLS